jgi:molybdenum-dependent DNA-binding transcriptional regulator ModE
MGNGNIRATTYQEIRQTGSIKGAAKFGAQAK